MQPLQHLRSKAVGKAQLQPMVAPLVGKITDIGYAKRSARQDVGLRARFDPQRVAAPRWRKPPLSREIAAPVRFGVPLSDSAPP